jgi:hypothetical protein
VFGRNGGGFYRRFPLFQDLGIGFGRAPCTGARNKPRMIELAERPDGGAAHERRRIVEQSRGRVGKCDIT